MNKKAQVTVFIAVAIIIVALAGVMYYFTKDKNKGNEVPLSPEGAEFRVYMDSCLNEGLENGLKLIGNQGGYFNFDSYEGIEFFSITVPYYVKEKELKIPSKEQIVKELEDYMGAYTSLCLGDYVNYETKVDEEINLKIETSLAKNKVSMKINYPVTLVNNDNSTTIVSDFEIEKQVRLEKVYEQAQKIVVLHLADPYNICINCLEAIKDEDMLINGYTYENNTIVFMLRDYGSYSENVRQDNYEPYRYFFAIKYIDWSCDNLPSDIDLYIREDCELGKLKISDLGEIQNETD